MINQGPGWLTKEDCEFHRKHMKKSTGKILEGGAFGGKLFSYLQPFFPEWEYHAVNAWTEHRTYIPFNDKLSYEVDPNYLNRKSKPENLMTMEKFKKHCPYATATDGLFEKYQTEHKFDLISIGQVHDKINWTQQYSHAASLLKPDGIIIARHREQPWHSKGIRKATKRNKFEIIDINENGKCFACRADYKPYVCNYCSTGFTNEKALAVHMCEKKRRHIQKKIRKN